MSKTETNDFALPTQELAEKVAEIIRAELGLNVVITIPEKDEFKSDEEFFTFQGHGVQATKPDESHSDWDFFCKGTDRGGERHGVTLELDHCGWYRGKTREEVERLTLLQIRDFAHLKEVVWLLRGRPFIGGPDEE